MPIGVFPTREGIRSSRSIEGSSAEEGDNIPWDQVKADLGWV
jgi:hypothetical protein